MQICGQPWRSTTSASTFSESLKSSMTRPLVPSSSTATWETGSEQKLDSDRAVYYHQPSSICFWKGSDRHHRRSWRSGQHWTDKSRHSLRLADQCREEQADDKQHKWNQYRHQSRWTEAWDSHKLPVPGLSYNWWEFQAWDFIDGVILFLRWLFFVVDHADFDIFPAFLIS